MSRLAAAILVLVVFPAAARAYEIDRRIVPQPEVRYFVALKDWRKPMDRVVKALNRARVGVELVKSEIARNASIQVGRLERRCGLPGVDATTQTLVGGFAAIYLPYGCKGQKASILAAHELGHALGLLHEDDVCALMNSSGTGAKGTPTECLGERHPWKAKPWRPDDLAGLRELYDNDRPKARLRLTGPGTVPVGTPVTFKATLGDPDRNLSETVLAFGDGTKLELIAGEPLPTSHTYSTPGRYRIRVTTRDFYGARASDSVSVVVRDQSDEVSVDR